MQSALFIRTAIPAAVAALSVLLITAWLSGLLPSPDNLVGERPGSIPSPRTEPHAAASAVNTATPAGTAPTPATSTTPGVKPVAGGQEGSFTNFGGAAPSLPGAWPRFRGPNGDGVSPEKISLSRDWNAKPPRLLWSIDLGDGHAGAAVLNGRVYILDYDKAAGADALRCFALATGKELWRRSYPVEVKQNHGMSRTVPAVTEKYVVTLGPKCHVLCVDATSGAFRWKYDLVKQFRTAVPPWYAGQCPLIDNGKAIIAPGGTALLIAVDCATGKIVWQTPNPRRWKMSHASVIPMTVNGQRTYVYVADGGVVGVSAATGAILWETNAWKVQTATVPTPVPVGDGRLFLTGGYSAGSMMLKITGAGGRFTAMPLFRLPPETWGSDQQTPIFYRGALYGTIPGGQLACLDLNGKTLWTSGPTHRFGLGPYIIADGIIYIMNDSGVLTLVEATTAGYQQLAQAKILNGFDAWGPLALVGGRLLARDSKRMVCLDVAKR
ncbi:MAG: outer membrane protein assembly factor BamB family protein [Armatimonadota bacterium]